MNPVERIAAILRDDPSLQLGILFGSLASGDARAENDADVAVLAKHSLQPSQRIDVISRRASATGRPIDLIDLETVGEPLLGKILAGGLRLFGDESSYAALMLKHVVDAADFMPYRERLLAERRRNWIAH